MDSIFFFTWFQVKDHVQCLAIVRHLLIQARQVKLVLYVVFINLEHKIEEAKALPVLIALIKAHCQSFQCGSIT